jgi:hypothetical protein
VVIGRYIVEDDNTSVRTQRRAFIALHVTLALVAVVQGGGLLHHSVAELADHQHLAMFAGLQVVAGMLFLLPRTLRAAGILLIAGFTHAALLEAWRGEFPAAALVFAAAALFVTVHGAAWRSTVTQPGTV